MEELGTIHQAYLVEIVVYDGFKIKLGDQHYETYLKQDFYTYAVGDVCFVKGNQKTLSSTSKTKATMVSYCPRDEVGEINAGDWYYVCDVEENEYIAFGKVLEVIKQA